MPELRLRDSHTSVRDYYKSLRQYSLLEATHEGAVHAAFGTLLHKCAVQFEWAVIGQYELPRDKQRSLRVDGAVLDRWKLPRGYWEAKDDDDDLALEAKKKIALGYPTDNILFQSPERAILYQNGKRVLDAQLSDPATLVDVLKAFFEYEPPAFAEWERAAEDFGAHVPKLAKALLELIEKERRESKRFAPAFEQFLQVCRASINPNLAEVAVEKMLVQHLLTERIFRKVFDNPDFARRNVIAIEIEKVIDALTGRVFTRQKFLGELDRFYVAIEKTAGTLDDNRDKQHFLNSVYERFFQSFDAKVADTHGIVYTPQSIVRFMVRSVEHVLQNEFGSSLGHRNVHIIDPFVGTGNFLVHVLQQIPASQLEHKFANDLHANEVMLLPYYIASMNIEQAYVERTGEYRAFEGICLVDTFELAEGKQRSLAFMSEANSERVARQKRAPIFVVLGNPPYNANQVDENDRNKNRKYPLIDSRVRETYGHNSRAKLLNKLNDPYVKALRWATDRIGESGVVAFVTNNSFVHARPFDAMRRELIKDFTTLYVVDLGGDVRKNPRLSGTTNNVFGIQVGVSLNILVRQPGRSGAPGKIRYFATDEFARRDEKLRLLDEAGSVEGIEWKTLEPDTAHTWVRDGLRDDFDSMMPLGLKGPAGKGEPKAIFATFSNGLKSNDDAHVFRFDKRALTSTAKGMVDAYNTELARWQAKGRPADVDSFIRVDERELKWIFDTKQYLMREIPARFEQTKIRKAVYRPFTAQYVFAEKLFVNRLYQLPKILPASVTGLENTLLITTADSQIPFSAQASNLLPSVHVGGRPSMCFPFYTYDEDGSRRFENITNWALDQFRQRYSEPRITRTNIFHYVYAILHNADYRARYAVNLQRDLPRVPFASDFWAFCRAGERLLDLHLNYEKQPEYELRSVEMPGAKLDWRVTKMHITKDRQGIVYNDFLTLADIPREVFDFKMATAPRLSGSWTSIRSPPIAAAASPTTLTAPTIRSTSFD